MLRALESYAVQIVVTLALATAGYSLSEFLHVSAPLAMVVMGLVVGNQNSKRAMSARTREHLFGFWGLLDELLNLVLFTLIGLQVIAVSFEIKVFWVALATIPIVLVARAISVAIPLATLRSFREVNPHSVKIMTWGGPARRYLYCIGSIASRISRARNAYRCHLPGSRFQPTRTGHYSRFAG